MLLCFTTSLVRHSTRRWHPRPLAIPKRTISGAATILGLFFAESIFEACDFDRSLDSINKAPGNCDAFGGLPLSWNQDLGQFQTRVCRQQFFCCLSTILT